MIDLYSSEYNHRGYINSIQKYIGLIDVDFISSDNNFTIDFTNNLTLYPLDVYQLNICPYQKSFDINFINMDKKSISEISIYDRNNNDLNFKKEIDNNSKVKFNIPKDIRCRKDEFYILKDKKNDLMFKIFVNYNASKRIYAENGEEKIINDIEKYLTQNKITSNIYRTQNGLRVILLDKLRGLFDKDSYQDYKSISNSIYGDDLYLKYVIARGAYSLRLTPKFRSYKLIDQNNYKEYEEKFKESLGLKYLHGLIRAVGNPLNGKKIIDSLSRIYLKSDKYSVAKIINRIGDIKDKDISNFIEFHDKWTKANKINTILV